MNKQIRNCIILAGASWILSWVVACTREKETEEFRAVQFGVSALYENGLPNTKTAFSGEDQDGNGIGPASMAERIDWLSTDRIRILCAKASVEGSDEKYADYKISDAGSGGQKSIVPVGNGLLWGSGSHNFYALYPSFIQNSASTIALDGTGAAVTGTIPSTQSATLEGRVFKPDMDYAYMYAVTPNVTGEGSVSLNFRPLVTAMEFTLYTRNGDAVESNLTGVTLSSSQTDSYLSGTFGASLTTSGLTALTTSDITDGGNSIVIELPDGGVQLSTDASEAYTVTFLALPMAQTDLTLKLSFADGSSRSLDLKDSDGPVTIDACTKAYIWKLDVPLTLPTYSIASVISDISQEGSGVTMGESQTITVAVNKESYGTITPGGNWKAYFSDSQPNVGDEVSSSWSETPLQDGDNNDWLSLDAYSGNGLSNPVRLSLSGAPTSATQVPGTSATEMITNLRSGAGVNDLDLSTYDIITGSMGGVAETANCYVIKTYGSYLIPCVYGNAWKGGMPNTDAYINETSPTSVPTKIPVLNHFVNVDGREIGAAVIPDDSNLTKSSNLSARVVWQDVMPGFEMLTDANLEYVSTPGTAVNCPYIRVTFPQARIVPGNVVVALYDDDNQKILWSWHLWVTTEALTNVYALQSATKGNDFLNANLGWTPPISYTAGSTPERSQYVIIACGGKVIDSFEVSQASFPTPELSCTQFSNTFYQWGRKDPFLPSSGENTNKAISYNPAVTTLTCPPSTVSIEQAAGGGDTPESRIGWVIQYPYIYNIDNVTYPNHANLWNAVMNGFTDMAVTKTVYDPSPRGYKIPNRNAFRGFTKTEVALSSANIYGEKVSASGELPPGYLFTTNNSNAPGTYTFYFPSSGRRRTMTNADSNIVDVSDYGTNWTSGLYNQSNDRDFYAFYFQVSQINCRSANQRLIRGYSVRPIKDVPAGQVNYVIASETPDIIQSGDEVVWGLNKSINVSVWETSGGSTVTKAAAWKAYFSDSESAIGDDVSSSWSETPLKDADNTDWLRLSAYAGDGNGNPVTVSVSGATLSGVTMLPGTSASEMIANLRSGAGVNDLDLSTYDIITGSTGGAAETANCYVIKSYGSYLIPCVYGNAWKNGAANSRAYSPGTSGSNILQKFINADGKAITNAIITDDTNLSKSLNLSARVVWQDVMPGFEMLTDANLEFVSTPGTAVNCPYIRVTFPQDRIVPGNVVVALYDDDNQKILWSWHLWVTPEALTTVNVLRSNNATSDDFLNANLGWTPPISYSGGTSHARDQFVIIACTDNNKVIDCFRVSQEESSTSPLTCTKYSNTFYQWGRKDPFLPVSGGPTDKAISYNTAIISPTNASSVECAIAGGSTVSAILGWMVINPYVFNLGTTRVPNSYNLWDATLTTTGSDHAVVKTVYDPSPRGFRMPSRNAYTGFTSDGNPQETVSAIYGDWVEEAGECPAGYNFTTTHTNENKTFFFPITLTRMYDTSSAEGSSNASYHSASPNNNLRRNGLNFGQEWVKPMSYGERTYGNAVRPVRE